MDDDVHTSEADILASEEPLVERQSPFIIATTQDDVRAIIAMQDGSIPVTSIDVPEIMNGQANGVIITEQCLYEALVILNEAYSQSHAIENLVTSSVQFSPKPTAEQWVDIIVSTFVSDVVRAAMELGYVEESRSIGLYPEEFNHILYELDYLFSLYSACGRTLQEFIYQRRSLSLYCDTIFPPNEIIHEVAQRLYGTAN